MATIITTHSFRGGTGKSTITSNMAALLAKQGFRVALIDTDVKSPGVHALFGLHDFGKTLNDYLKGSCRLSDIVYDVSSIVGLKSRSLYLVPSSIAYGEIAGALLEKFSHKRMQHAFNKIIEDFELDILLIDTHPGVNEEMLVSAALSDVVLVVVRPDNQDYQGAETSLDMLAKINVNTRIVVNKVHKKTRSVVEELKRVFSVPIVGTIPFSEDVMLSESQYLFSLEHPRHAVTKALDTMIHNVLEEKN